MIFSFYFKFLLLLDMVSFWFIRLFAMIQILARPFFFLRSFLKWSTVTNCAYWLCDRKQNIATGPSISVKIRLNCNNWFVFKTFPLLIIILTSCTFYPYNGRSSIELEQHDKKEWALFRILHIIFKYLIFQFGDTYFQL